MSKDHCSKKTSADSDSEEDYMSDNFIVQSSSETLRPSLLYNRGQKRKHEMLKKQQEENEAYKSRFKSRKLMEQETRDAGLQKKLGEDNKGFQLLSKMGYKPGNVIGKPNQQTNALKEPIPVEVKLDRKGLGQKSKDLDALNAMKQRKSELETLSDPNTFRMRVQAVAAAKELEKDLSKAQAACRNLDETNGLEAPQFTWFWPFVEKIQTTDDCDDLESDANSKDEKFDLLHEVVDIDSEDSAEIDIEQEPESQEKLLKLTAYLRLEYNFCIWCGASYENQSELLQLCPGQHKDDH